MFSSRRTVCVVGGGPAGLASAIALRREGCEVTVVDGAAPPIDKACGEGLLPDSEAAFRELGVEVPADVGFAFRGIRFADERSTVSADFPHGSARGLRRIALHELLSRHAKRVGVRLEWNAKRVRLVEGGVSIDGGSLKAELVVGADGQNSNIRRQAGLDAVKREKRRYGFRRHYRMAPWSSYMEFYWGTASQIYVTPVATDEVCVAVLSRDPQLRLERALRHFPEVRRRLGDAEPVSAEMGGLSISRSLRRLQRGSVVLVGDASGSVDAITGEGICLGMRQALALAEAVRRTDLRIYEQRHRALMRRPQTMASLMLLLERNGRLQRRVLAGLAQRPDVFESLIAIHVGASSFLDLCSWGLMDFGRAFLAS